MHIYAYLMHIWCIYMHILCIYFAYSLCWSLCIAYAMHICCIFTAHLLHMLCIFLHIEWLEPAHNPKLHGLNLFKSLRTSRFNLNKTFRFTAKIIPILSGKFIHSSVLSVSSKNQSLLLCVPCFGRRAEICTVCCGCTCCAYNIHFDTWNSVNL